MTSPPDWVILLAPLYWVYSSVNSLLIAQGMLFALVMGILGGLLPARVAARKPVLDALKAA